jgi:hypothetical protein
MSAMNEVTRAVADQLCEAWYGEGKTMEVVKDFRWIAVTRAAVAALAAQGDITDEQIASAIDLCPCGECRRANEQQIATVRALLARQAAVHATQVIEREVEHRAILVRAEAAEARIVADAALANTMILESDARAEAAEARVAELTEQLRLTNVDQLAAEARVAELEKYEGIADSYHQQVAALDVEVGRLEALLTDERNRATAEVTALRATADEANRQRDLTLRERDARIQRVEALADTIDAELDALPTSFPREERVTARIRAALADPKEKDA